MKQQKQEQETDKAAEFVHNMVLGALCIVALPFAALAALGNAVNDKSQVKAVK